MPITVTPLRASLEIVLELDADIVVSSPTVTGVVKEGDDRDTIIVSGFELEAVSGSDPAQFIGYVPRSALIPDGEDPDEYDGHEYWLEVDYDDGDQSSRLFTDKFVTRWG